MHRKVCLRRRRTDADTAARAAAQRRRHVPASVPPPPSAAPAAASCLLALELLSEHHRRLPTHSREGSERTCAAVYSHYSVFLSEKSTFPRVATTMIPLQHSDFTSAFTVESINV